MLSGLIIGMLFGILLQRSQFCFVSGFRNIFTQKTLRFPTALFIAVAIQSVGFFTLQAYGIIELPRGEFSLSATIFGGLLFGLGMAASGCCGSGTWFRSGEGLVGAWLALFSFCLTMASMQSGILKHWFGPWLQQHLMQDSLYATWQINPWYGVILLCLIALALFINQLRHPRYQFQDPTKRVKNLPLFLGAVLIGLLGIAAWYFSAQTGRNYGFGIAVPSANVVQYIVTGQQRYLNWGSLFVIGILIGSFAGAKLCSDFKLTLPAPEMLLRRLLGGVVMGIGAGLAGGCTVTNSLVATAYFSAQGWIATAAILVGVWLSTFIFKTTQCRT
ncbi:YeeE/YedE family protein [Aggregatibacter actinomycetemcomitans]|nr:YeeE/YedE family protein [Aggregatibacter actinomycetemcomitans]